MNAIAGPSSLSPPAPSSQPQRKPRGKKGKVFSENLGLSHLLSLAAEAGSTEEGRNQSRVEKNKETSQWKKEKREAKEQRKERAKAKEAATGKTTSDGSTKTTPAARSKAVIRAELKAKRREKTKLRKEKRKAIAELGEYKSDDDDDEEQQASSTPFVPTGVNAEMPGSKNNKRRERKTVSFA